MSFQKDVIEKLTKIEVQLGVNNQILDTHHKRSLHLESRIEPLEKSHIFFSNLAKAITGLVTVAAGIAAIVHYLK